MYYTAEELIERASSREGFSSIPNEYWLCFVRRNLDDQKPNEFNDRCYLMKGRHIVLETSCTTVPGLPALKGGYKKYNKKGACVLKSDIWMNDAFAFGLHNGRMESLREVENLWSYRDGDLDSIAEENGVAVYGMWHTNIHCATYNLIIDFVRKLIGQWSYGCIVLNATKMYRRLIRLTKSQRRVSAIILNEFSI